MTDTFRLSLHPTANTIFGHFFIKIVALCSLCLRVLGREVSLQNISVLQLQTLLLSNLNNIQNIRVI